jgi:hypothetical protein
VSTNILILAAGDVADDQNDRSYPTCLSELDGTSLIERIINNTRSISNSQYAFAFRKEDTERFHLDSVASLLVPGAKIIQIPERTKGSACTALLAACQLPQQHALLVVSANELVDLEMMKPINDFAGRGLDGGALVFRSIQPRYSYVRVDSSGMVTEAAQRNPISQHATAGVFWFQKTSEFVDAVKSGIRKNAVVDGSFFVSLAFNELLLKQMRIGVFALETTQYRPLKTGRQVQQFEQRGADV